MSEGKFDPALHLIQLPGRGGKGPTDYLPVAARIAWFRAEHPDGHIVIDHIELTDRRAVFKVEASYPTEGGGRAGGQGYGSETPGDFKDYIEKASTKALGRALAALGYGTLQAGDELDEGARIVDTPQTKPTPRAGTTPGREPAPRSTPQRPTPSDRPAAVPSAAGPPSAVTPAEEARLMGRLDKVDAHYNGGKGEPDVAQALVPNNAGGMRTVDVPMDDDLPAKPAKRAPTVAEALTVAGNETLSAKARQYAAVRGLEACPTLDEAADYYLKVLPVAPEREALEAAYKARNEALRVEAGLPF